MALKRLRVGVQSDDERRLGDESVLRFASPFRENAMPTSEIELYAKRLLEATTTLTASLSGARD